ncbi:hypothetical protein HWV62_39009 [Athelia sp. TMB]|nr:hypothetical protein HWV62_39009 [Athelia sp. TMB]
MVARLNAGPRAIETVQTMTQVSYIYSLTVTNYGDIALVSQGHWSLNISALFDGLTGALVQAYFAHRIHVLSGGWTITVVSWFFSFVALMGTTAITVLGQVSASIVDFERNYVWIVTTSLVLLVFVDIINTVSLCTFLRVEKTGSRSADHLLNKLFLWTIQTGIVTSIGGLVMMILSLTNPETSYWIAVSLFYAKFYSNAFMATLNARDGLRTAPAHLSDPVTGVEPGTMQFVTVGSDADLMAQTFGNETIDLEMQTRASPGNCKNMSSDSAGTAVTTASELLSDSAPVVARSPRAP